MKIAILTRGKGLQEEYYQELLGEDVDVISALPDESEIPIPLTARDQMNFVEAMKRAEKEGYDAAISVCHADPGVEEARTYCSIPILGAGQVGLHFASMLGYKFSILTPSQDVRREWQRKIEVSGYEARLASIRSSDVGHAFMGEQYEESKKTKEIVPGMQKTLDDAIKAIEEDEASVLVIGCGGLLWTGYRLPQLLKERGYDVTVINPLPLTIEVAKALVTLKLSHSRLAYLPSI